MCDLACSSGQCNHFLQQNDIVIIIEQKTEHHNDDTTFFYNTITTLVVYIYNIYIYNTHGLKQHIVFCFFEITNNDRFFANDDT